MFYLRMQQPEQSGRWPDGRIIRWLASLFKRKPQAIKRLEVQPHFQRISREATREFRAAVIRPPTLKIIVDLAELTDEDCRLIGNCVDKLPRFVRPANLVHHSTHRQHLLNNVVSRRLIVSLDAPPLSNITLLGRVGDYANLARRNFPPQLLADACGDFGNGFAAMGLEIRANRIGDANFLFAHVHSSYAAHGSWTD